MARQYLQPQGKPAITKDFAGFKFITRRYKVSGEATKAAVIDTELFLNYGTPDIEFPAALLIQRTMEPMQSAPNTVDTLLVEVYREFSNNTKVLVGEDVLSKNDNGLTSVTKKYVALATQAEALAAAIGDVAGGKACSSVQIQNQGIGATIIETYITSGKISEVTEANSNGKLTTKTLVYFNEVPPTPAGGYVLLRSQVQNTGGVPTYTYTFSQSGMVSEVTEINSRGKLGTKTLVYFNQEPTAPAGYTLIRSQIESRDGLPTYTYTYSQSGKVSETTEISYNGSLTMKTLVYFNEVPPTPADYTLIRTQVQSIDGLPTYTYTYYTGSGLSKTSVTRHRDGLLETTYVSLGTKQTPNGIVTRDEYSEQDGYRIYIVTAVEITGAEYSIQQYVNFQYPGRVKVYRDTFTSGGKLRTLLDVYVSPPVSAKVLADIAVSFSTGTNITVEIWNPTNWASVEWQYVGYGNSPRSGAQAFPGHTHVGGTVSDTAGTTDPLDLCCRGQPCFAGTAAYIKGNGGYYNPAGYKVLDYHVDESPVIVGIDGTKYFRHTQVSATIPAQQGLPV